MFELPPPKKTEKSLNGIGTNTYHKKHMPVGKKNTVSWATHGKTLINTKSWPRRNGKKNTL